MRYVVFAEVALMIALFGGGIYAQATARGSDGWIIASTLFMAVAVMAAVLVGTLLGWWAWSATFR